MKVKDCTHGKIVCNTHHIGMIVGITNNCPSADSHERSLPENINIIVQWSDGRTTHIHAGHLSPYKG